MKIRRLPSLTLALALALIPGAGAPALAGPPGAVAGVEKPDEILQRAEALLKRKKLVSAVRVLRELVRAHTGTREAEKAREILAGRGYGLDFSVVFKQAPALEVKFTRAELVQRAEETLAKLRVFFRQTYPRKDGKLPSLDFRIDVHDSRARFRKAFPGTRIARRSALTLPGRGKSGVRRPTISVFYDAKFVHRQDIRDVLHKSIAREMAALLLLAHTRNDLPDALETGLCEYLAARLFPRELKVNSYTLEDLLRGFARLRLGPLKSFAAFRNHLFSASPEGERAPGLYWQWAGLSYAVFDCLVNGDLGRGATPARAPGTGSSGGKATSGAPGASAARAERDRTPRNAELQEFLRDFELRARSPRGVRPGRVSDDTISLVERLLLDRFQVNLSGLHRALIEHVQRYPLEIPFSDQYSNW